MPHFREFILRLNLYDCAGYTLLQKCGISVQKRDGESRKDTREKSRKWNYKVFLEGQMLTDRRDGGLFKKSLNTCDHLTYSLEKVNYSTEKNLKDVYESNNLREKEKFADQHILSSESNFAYHNEQEVMISSTHEKEVKVYKSILIYLALEGNIICVIRGHALAAMNEQKLIGGIPVKVLDCQVHGPIKEVAIPCKAITSNSKMVIILANVINGERVQCEVISRGMSHELKDVDLNINGNTVDEAKLLITTRGVKIVAINCPDEDAILAVRLSNIVALALEHNCMLTFT